MSEADRRRALAAELRREARRPNPMRGFITQREWQANCLRRAAMFEADAARLERIS
jgi:hypothetical protein